MLTRENVTLGIAVASFVLSVWNFALTLLKARKRLDIKVQNVFSFTSALNKTTEILNLHITNKSREPITLSGLRVSCDKSENLFGEYRIQLLRTGNTLGGKELRREQWYSKTFPAKIEGLGCTHLLLSSSGYKAVIKPGFPCRAEFSTNKGYLNVEFTISDFSDSKLLEQCQEPDLLVQSLK